MTIYNLECPQCRNRANLDVLKMEFIQNEQNNKSILSLLCRCSFCGKNSVIDAEIAQWGEIRGYPVQEKSLETPST